MIFNIKYYLPFILILFILIGCEEEITLDLPQSERKLVVEGYIEPGMPPYVLLTQSIPYFSNITEEMKKYFVHDAIITVSDGSKTVELIEIDLSNLPDSLAQMILNAFQFSVDSVDLSDVNFSFYTTIQMFGETGKEYSLEIKKDEHHLTAVTKIPNPVVPDSIWFEPSPYPEKDTLKLLKFKITDPAGEPNFYRFFSNRNDEPFYPNPFFSVSDDVFFDGQEIAWTIMRGQSSDEEWDPETFGYFTIGDTVTMKLCTIDKGHYDFWSTIETAQYSGGPFASPVEIKTNINGGGLGIWGGYGAAYIEIVVE